MKRGIYSPMNTPNFSFSSATISAFDFQFDYMLTKSYGVGLGLAYQSGSGTNTLDRYAIDYLDSANNDPNFPYLRRVFSKDALVENVSIQSIDLRLSQKVLFKLSEKLDLSFDLSLLLPLSSSSKMSIASDSRMNYEGLINIGKGMYFSNIDTTNGSLWRVTEEHLWLNYGPNGQSQIDSDLAMFNRSYRDFAFNVVHKTSEQTLQINKTFGILLRPNIRYHINKDIHLLAGLWLQYDSYKQETSTSYQLTDGSSQYNSFSKTINSINTFSYGFNIGAQFNMNFILRKILKVN
jgi:hypothetical protein